jgi:hypothetical protein
MKNKNEIENLVNKELNRLSHDFELDLIRLLKTLSLISQSKSILEKHTEYLRGRSAEFQNRLSGFTIALLELEKEIGEFPQIPTEVGKELKDKLNRHIERLKVILRDYIAYTREMNGNLEKTSGEYINSLELAHRFYTLELQSSQIELDSRLKELESKLSKTLAETSTLENERETTPQKSEEHTPDDVSHVDELSIKSPKKSLKDFVKRNKGITFGLVSLIFVALLFGLWIFNNRRELEKIGVRLRAEAVLPKETSKEVVVEFGKAEKRTSEDKISQEKMKEVTETYPTKKEEAKEKIQQPLSQKKLLTVIGSGAYVRGGPGINYPIFSVVKKGEVFERLDGELGKWIKIKTQDGTVGWISKKVVREIGE